MLTDTLGRASIAREPAPPNLIEALTRTVTTDRRGQRLDAQNKVGGWADISTLVADGAAFFVTLDADVLGLDADTREASHLVTQIAHEMREAGLRPVVLESGRPGNLHLFVRITHAETFSRYAERAKAGGVDVRRTQRPPLSAHRLGLKPRLITPETPSEALSALQRVSVPSAPGKLGKVAQNALRYGKADSSAAVQSVALGAVNAGLSEPWLYSVLRDTRNVGGRKVQAMNEHKARPYVARSYQRALERAATHPVVLDQNGAHATIAEYRRIVDRAHWKGVGGASDYTVLVALYGIADRIGNVARIGASVRELAELSGKTIATVSRSLRRLEKDGWLRPIARGSEQRAGRFALTLPLDVLTVDRERGCECRHAVDLGADVWRWRGLGATKGRLWGALCDHEQTTDQLAERFGVKAGTMRRHLATLEHDGLARRAQDGWVLVADTDLEQIALELGTAGNRERDKARHERQREALRARRAERLKEYATGHYDPVTGEAIDPPTQEGTEAA